MGTIRRCDDRCHNAKNPHCKCWCHGNFHGAAGAKARREFAELYLAAKRDDEQRSQRLEPDYA